jgi:hypothetical protein
MLMNYSCQCGVEVYDDDFLEGYLFFYRYVVYRY